MASLLRNSAFGAAYPGSCTAAACVRRGIPGTIPVSAGRRRIRWAVPNRRAAPTGWPGAMSGLFSGVMVSGS
jgi:hypothetical protein